ncbi:MAG: hypothetical protein ACOVLE_11280, partial [Pirellula staleyi]
MKPAHKSRCALGTVEWSRFFESDWLIGRTRNTKGGVGEWAARDVLDFSIGKFNRPIAVTLPEWHDLRPEFCDSTAPEMAIHDVWARKIAY